MMKWGKLTVVGVIVASLFSLWATPALAYFGPGAGLSAIGAFLALIIGVIAAFFGFIWYPVKRLLRRGKTPGAAASAPPQKPQVTSVNKGI